MMLSGACCLLLITLVSSQTIEFREKTPPNKSFMSFPETLGQWNGVRKTMRPGIIDKLALSDHIIIDYENADGKTVNLYVAYYESQGKGKNYQNRRKY